LNNKHEENENIIEDLKIQVEKGKFEEVLKSKLQEKNKYFKQENLRLLLYKRNWRNLKKG